MYRITLVLGCLFALFAVASPAQAVRIMTYNILNYTSGRTAEFQTVIEDSAPEVIFVEEILSSTGVNNFLNTVLNVIEPGEWAAGPFVNGPDTDNAVFYKPALVEVTNHFVISTTLRDIDEWTIRPAGTTEVGNDLRVYVVHLKASQGSSNVTRRLQEVTAMRARMETFPPGQNYMVLGDFNIYTSSESPYTYMLGTSAGLSGVVVDPIDTPGNWHNSSVYASIHTQSPRTSQFGGGATGGLDDRFDMILVSPSLMDDEQWSILDGSYTAFGQDGLHFNAAIIDSPPNVAVSPAVAQALHDGSDHLPVFADFEIPAQITIDPPLAIGPVIVGGVASSDLTAENVAPEPADELDYSFSAPSGFSAPAGSFELQPDDGPFGHTISIDTDTAGNLSGDLIVTTDAPDDFSVILPLTGTVLDHAAPSLSGTGILLASTLDIGVVAEDETQSGNLDVFNFGYGSLQALLDVYEAEIVGDSGFSLVGGFNPAMVGSDAATYAVEFDATGASPGPYSATLTLRTRDQQDLSGAILLADLIVGLEATVGQDPASVDPEVALVVPGLQRSIPSPFVSRTEVQFGVSSVQTIGLSVFDTSGRFVRNLASGQFPVGVHRITWDGRDNQGEAVPSGIYFLRLQSATRTETRPIIRMR